jgi:hypothetical protein
LGRVAELASALGREIEFALVSPKRRDGQNVPMAKPEGVQDRETLQLSKATGPVTLSSGAKISEMTA